MTNQRGASVKAMLLAAGAAMMLVPSAVYAQSSGAPASYDSAEQDLGTALTALGRKANREIYFSSELTRGKRAPMVRGARSWEDALRRLLAGTGLTYRINASGAIVIEQGARASSSGVDVSTGLADTAADTEIVVTGSHIRGAGTGGSPGLTIGRDDIDRSAAATVEELFRKIPQNFPGGANDYASAIGSSRNGNSNNFGLGNGINLRGLGNGSTLVLLDGHRIAPGGTGGFVDVSTIPLTAVERVSVVTDGASAIYGSDAIAGVVNFQLRDDYEGAETSLRYGSVTKGGLDEFQANLLAGHGWSSGNLLVNIDYFKKTPLLASDRDYATALATLPFDLIPGQERTSILAKLNQDFSDGIGFSLTGYYNERKVAQDFFSAVFPVSHIDAKVKQYGGILAVDVELPGRWRADISFTGSKTDTRRENSSATSPTAPPTTNSVNPASVVWTAALGLEGPLFAIGDAEARMALGAEYREEDFDIARVGFGTPRFSLDRNVQSYYAELHLPLLSRGSGVGKLDLSAALRHERYSDFGTTTNPKLGLVWSPSPALDFRATYGTSFRAPFLNQFDNSATRGLLARVPNPASPTGTSVIAIVAEGAAPNLGPERARTWTAGFDLHPPSVGGLQVSGNYFSVRYRDRIESNIGVLFDAFTNPVLAARLSVPADPALIAALRGLTVLPLMPGLTLDAAEATLEGRLINVAATEIEGLDFIADYRFGTGIGKLGLSANATYFLNYDVTPASGAAPVDILNTVFNPVDLRIRGGATLETGPVVAAVFLNYTDGYRDNQRAAIRKIDSWTTLDVSLALDLGKAFDSGSLLAGTSLLLSASNLFDADPPRVDYVTASYGSPGYDTENANPLGRFVSVTLRKRW